MASKARQSLLGGFFGLSLNLVILPFFMRLRSSDGYDADDLASHRVSDEEHSAVDQANSIETQSASDLDATGHGGELVDEDGARGRLHVKGREL
jgi:hypothetical protein